LRKYARVSYAVRCQIYALLKTQTPISSIAALVGHHKSTIYRELKRNTGCRNYIPDRAQRFSEKRSNLRVRRPVIQGNLKKALLRRLAKGWSPEIIAGRFQKEKMATLSHETIYRFLRSHPEYAVRLRFYKRRGYGRYRQAMARPEWMIGIKERPKIVDTRTRFGDWERDTMYTKNRGFLLVCQERKSRLVKIAELKTHKAEEVAVMTTKLLTSAGRKVYTVTNDNGGEFRWKEPLGYKCFYCEPHKPHQRGSVENVIGLIRQYIKRDTDLKDVNLKQIEYEINGRPRKVLNYKTPFEVFYKKSH
jgi:transposase, IS30 family